MTHQPLIAALTFFVASAAWAGNTNSGGGDAVVCRDAQRRIISARLFDFWEAEKLGMPVVDLGAANLGVEAKAKKAVGRLTRFDPVRARSYAEQVDGFFANALVIPNIVLRSIDDIRNTFEPTPGCTIEQLAVQREPETPAQKRFTVSKDLYDALENDDHRAGLILHEIIYWEARQLGHTDSVRTRYFNGMISSAAVEAMAQADYQALLAAAGLPEGRDDRPDSVHCVEQDPGDEEQGWWETKILKSRPGGGLVGEVWWRGGAGAGGAPRLACSLPITLTDSDESLTYQAKDDGIYLYVKDIESGEGYGKLWTSGCGAMPDLNKIRMDCRIR